MNRTWNFGSTCTCVIEKATTPGLYYMATTVDGVGMPCYSGLHGSQDVGYITRVLHRLFGKAVDASSVPAPEVVAPVVELEAVL